MQPSVPEAPAASRLKRLAKACLIIIFVVLTVVSVAFVGAVWLTEGPDRLMDRRPEIRGETRSGREVRAGAATCEVRLPPSVLIAGYGANRVSTGVHDPIMARAVMVNGVVFLSFDLIGIHHSDLERLDHHLLDVSCLSLPCSTHNHEGPDTIGLWGKSHLSTGVDRAVLEACLDAGEQAAKEALRQMDGASTRCHIVIGSAQAPSKGISRNSRDPDLVDRTVTALSFVRDDDGKTVATIVHFACHPETLGSRNTLVSADFPGYLNSEVEKRREGVSLFLNGALGGMVTTDEKEQTFAEAERIGRTIGDIACDALESKDAVTLDQAPLAWVQEKIQVPIQNRMFHAAARLGVVNRPFKDGYVESEVDAIRIGPLTFVTAPGEVTPKVGFQLTDMITTKFKGVISLASDELGYIIDEKDYADTTKFRYERTMSPGPLATTLIRETARDAIARVTSGS